MAYGIKVWNSAGGVALNLSDRITRIMDWFWVNHSSSGSKFVADSYVSTGLVAFATPAQIPGEDDPTVPHRVVIGATTGGSIVSWSDTAASGYAAPSVIYIIRFK